MNLSFDQLTTVIAVAEEGSFSKAAEARLSAQSSLSRTVAQVERICGVRLFERTTRQVVLTREGEEFVEMATNIVATYQREIKGFAAYLAGARGVLRLAALPSLAASLLPQMITRFRGRFPEMLVEVEDVLAGQIADYVHSGAVDLAITAAPSQSPEALSAAGMQIRRHRLRSVLLRTAAAAPAARQARHRMVRPRGRSLRCLRSGEFSPRGCRPGARRQGRGSRATDQCPQRRVRGRLVRRRSGRVGGSGFRSAPDVGAGHHDPALGGPAGGASDRCTARRPQVGATGSAVP